MQVQIPGYRIRKVLGKGGMATVYLAVQEIFEREVALKVMSPSLAEDPSFGQRFMREARIVSQLVHPSIVTVFDVGVHENMYYLSMEYIPGPDLKQACKRLSILQRLAIILDVARALEFAGAKGYVHRDIKPENIILRDSSEHAVLMDFGIARAAETEFSVTQTGAAMGTPHYMSPEQARGKAVDHRSDLYSLGVVMYFVLMEQVPFHADSAVAIGIKHLTEPVPSLPGYLQPFNAIVTRLMAKKPENRYQNASELIADLERLDHKKILKHYSQRSKYPTPPAQVDGRAEPTVIENMSTRIDKALVTDARDTLSGRQTPLTLATEFAKRYWRYLAAASLVGVVMIAAVQGRSMLHKPSNAAPIIAKSQELAPTETPAPPESSARVGEIELASENQSHAGAKPEEGPVAKTTPPKKRTKQEANGTSVNSDEGKDSVDSVGSRFGDLLGRLNPKQRRLIEEVQQLREQMAANPNDNQALQNLNQLAKTQFSAVNKSLDRGEHKRLEDQVRLLGNLFPEYTAEMTAVQQRVKQGERLESFLQKAQQKTQGRQFFSPENDSAEYYYMEVLMMAPDSVAAQQGLVDMAQLAIADAKKSLADGDLDAAQTVVTKLLAIDPNHIASLELQKRINTAAQSSKNLPADEPAPEVPVSPVASQAKREQSASPPTKGKVAPVVNRLIVTAEPLDSVPQQQPPVVSARRTIYAGIEYQAFLPKTTLVNAVLYGPEGQAQANVPIKVERAQGKYFFRIDHRSAFASGDYELKIVWDGRTLQTTRFRVR